ncbi:hypothetical protein HDV00_010406 [Rhizophlyctis rosea]|nr:hypothetical protein HDV00_010406 [Rhizophlyctis rosea]
MELDYLRGYDTGASPSPIDHLETWKDLVYITSGTIKTYINPEWSGKAVRSFRVFEVKEEQAP